jgi:UDP-3-O-[3-hydroxymyristoyl] glucosamine N-acyltransferase
VLLKDIASRLQLVVEGDGDAEITGCAPIDEAGPKDLTFVGNPRYARLLDASRAGAVILAPGTSRAVGNVLRAASPQVAFAAALALFDTRPAVRAGIHPTAVIDDSATIGADCHVGAYVVVGEGVTLGDCSVLYPHVTIYPGATIGPRFVAHAGAVVREGAVIGSDVVLQPGAVIGADGFGFLPNPGGLPQAVPQIGTVEIGDHAEIGANTTVDRAAVGATRIGRGVKLDNLVQIAHGCQVGEGSLLAAQVGVAGSSRIGKNVLAGGQAGITGHASVGDGAQIAAQGGVTGDIPSGAVVAGMPAIDIKLWRRCMVALGRLPEILVRLRAVERRLAGKDENRR